MEVEGGAGGQGHERDGPLYAREVRRERAAAAPSARERPREFHVAQSEKVGEARERAALGRSVRQSVWAMPEGRRAEPSQGRCLSWDRCSVTAEVESGVVVPASVREPLKALTRNAGGAEAPSVQRQLHVPVHTT